MSQVKLSKDAVRKRLKVAIFDLAGVDRIHIVGVSRSGTTMLHLAMVCFENTILSDTETRIDYPYFSDRLRILPRMMRMRGKKFFVTKRAHDWFEESNVDRLIECVPEEKVGLIHLVRDPLDVLTSIHQAYKDDKARGPGYVTPERWHESVLAWTKISQSLPDSCIRIDLRYEDVVCRPDDAEDQISSAFGMNMREGLLGLNNLRSNFDRGDLPISSQYLAAVGSLRDMDQRSIGRGKREGYKLGDLVQNPEILSQVQLFCATHGYSTE